MSSSTFSASTTDESYHPDAYFKAICFFLAFMWVAAILRVYVRLGIVRKFGWDDGSMLITLILASGYISCIIGVAELTHDAPIGYGPGTAPWQNLVPATHLLVAGECLYIVATSMLKVSLGLLLLRVLVKQWQKITIYSVVAVCCAYGVGYFFVALFACGNPTDYLQNALVRNCISNAAINGTSYTHAVINAIADIIFAVLPVALLWNADMSKRSKISVGLILVLGSVGCIFTIIRIGFIHYLSAVSATYFVTGRPIALMSAAELSIGIVCICLATYKPLVHRFLYKDQYYTRPSQAEPSMHEATDTQTASSWRQSWRGSRVSSSQVTRPVRGYLPPDEARFGPEYRQEYKTMAATLSSDSPPTPSERTFGSKEWSREPTHSSRHHNHHHHTSELSDTVSSTRSPA